MEFEFLDHAFWQTLVTLIAVIAAYKIGKKQIKIQDTVELYASLLIMKNSENGFEIPHILIQNVGIRLVYLDKYIFNGKEYITDGQILPSTYSQAQNNFYRIQLPTNEEAHVSLDVFYHDLEGRAWNSKVFADRGGIIMWNIKTLPRNVVTK